MVSRGWWSHRRGTCLLWCGALAWPAPAPGLTAPARLVAERERLGGACKQGGEGRSSPGLSMGLASSASARNSPMVMHMSSATVQVSTAERPDKRQQEADRQIQSVVDRYDTTSVHGEVSRRGRH
jgi:hypothetical protein